jgi:cyanophycinase
VSAIKKLGKSKRAKAAEVKLKNAENHCPVPSSSLLIIGGKVNKGEEKPDNKQKPKDFIKLEVLQAFKKMIHKKDPVVEVITTSSGESAESFEEYKKVFEKLGISTINQIHHEKRSEVLEDPLHDRIKKADAFFFTGGDQLKITSIYGGTSFLTLLKERYIYESIVISGTSAGAMALSTPMIYAGNDEVQELGGAIKVAVGLEFLKDVCIDTHFVHRGRFVRMAQVVVTNPTCIGIGIEEDTAIIVRDGLEIEVIGTGLVIILEGFHIKEAHMDDFSSDKPITIRDIRMHMLSDGNKYRIPQINPPHK